jgi:diguanylate cyclase (GGDEF)-like protein
MLDRTRSIAEAVPVKQRLLPLGLGVLGLILGIIGAIADVPVLAGAAGVAAVLAGGGAWLTTTESAATRRDPQPKAPIASALTPIPESANEPVQPARAVMSVGDLSPDPLVTGALVDPETGLFNEEYFHIAVDTRVSAARRHLRPVAVVLFEVTEDIGTQPHPADPVAVADGIRATLREADTACRLDDGRFAFVLEDTPEDGAIWTIERLRRRLNDMGTEQVRWAGISCYPAHAFSSTEVLSKAERALTAAKEWAQDRIEVAGAD